MTVLTKRQKDTMKKHSVHHTKKHMTVMTTLMTRKNNPLNFTEAHKQAMKKNREIDMPKTKYSAKQQKIANVAAPRNEITKADFDKLRKNKPKKKTVLA